MSNRHCIDKILERHHSPANTTRRPTDIGRFEDGIPQQRTYNSKILLHLPQDMHRSILREPYCAYSPTCYSRVRRCFCPECVHPPTVPLARQSSPPIIVGQDRYRNPWFTDYPQGFGHDRDYRPLGNSSLATRPKHQSSSIPLRSMKKKKRHRTAFTPTQLLGLENSFEQNQYSVGEERKQLAAFLGLSETQIKVWFQNRRTKWKRIRKEAEEEDDVEPTRHELNNNMDMNFEASHSRCSNDRNEQPVYGVHPYERRWSFHLPSLERKAYIKNEMNNFHQPNFRLSRE